MLIFQTLFLALSLLSPATAAGHCWEFKTKFTRFPDDQCLMGNIGLEFDSTASEMRGVEFRTNRCYTWKYGGAKGIRFTYLTHYVDQNIKCHGKCAVYFYDETFCSGSWTQNITGLEKEEVRDKCHKIHNPLYGSMRMLCKH